MHETVRTVIFVCMIALVLCIFACLYRAIRGPRFTDRLVAANMIGTMTMAIISMLVYYLKESYLVDIAIVYSLLSFLAVVIVCRVATFHHEGKLLHKGEKKHD